MNTMPKMDPPKGLRGRALWADLAARQRRWIAWCEQNGTSYAGPNGPAIRAADEDYLRACEALATGGRRKGA